MKKAVLVTFEITTRVVVDEEDVKNENGVIENATWNIRDNLEGYLISDNVTSIVDDTECPFGSMPNETEE